MTLKSEVTAYTALAYLLSLTHFNSKVMFTDDTDYGCLIIVMELNLSYGVHVMLLPILVINNLMVRDTHTHIYTHMHTHTHTHTYTHVSSFHA